MNKESYYYPKLREKKKHPDEPVTLNMFWKITEGILKAKSDETKKFK